MRPSRHVRKLSEAEVFELDQTYWVTNNADMRTRCHIILLSNEGFSTPEIAQLVRFSEDTVLYWIDRFEAEGVVAARHSAPWDALPQLCYSGRSAWPSPDRPSFRYARGHGPFGVSK